MFKNLKLGAAKLISMEEFLDLMDTRKDNLKEKEQTEQTETI